MKKVVFFCLIFGAINTYSSTNKVSKSEHYFGFSMGNNLAYGRLKSDLFDYKVTLLPRLHAGFFYQTHPVLRFSFKLGAQYTAKGMHVKDDRVDYKLKIDYINVFTLATFNLLSSKRKIDPYVALGLYFGAAISGNLRLVSTTTGEVYGPLELTRERAAPTDMGVKIGVGVNYRITNTKSRSKRDYKVQLQVLQANSFYDSYGLNEANNNPIDGKRKLKAIESKVTFLIPIR